MCKGSTLMNLVRVFMAVLPKQLQNFECESAPVVATLEDVMTLEAFAGINRDASFVASQEDSNVKAEPDPQTAKLQMLENSQGTDCHSSDEEINNLPKEFNIVA